MYCSRCGVHNEATARFCVGCGEAMAGQITPLRQPVRPAGPKPDISNHLVISILVTSFCCLPLGIVALVYSAKVDTLVLNGEYEKAQRYSNYALRWNAAGAGVVLLAILAYLAVIAIGVATTATSAN